MKLQFISATPKIGPLRKTLGLADGSSRSYPLAAKVKTHEEEFCAVKDGLTAYRRLLLEHARQGHALYKGLTSKPLNFESRRGMTDKHATTEFVVLDIDDLEMELEQKEGYTREDVQKVAEAVIKMMPKDLHNVSYVAVASSSFGTSTRKVSVHIHFLLKDPVSSRSLKDWLLSLNYTQQPIFEKLTLTRTKTRLKSVVDPCLAEPARLIYIAPPYFGPRMDNPFFDDSHRIVLVEKKEHLLDLTKQLEELELKLGVVEKRKDKHLKELQDKAGVPTRKARYQRIAVNGQPMNVMANPPHIRMEFAYDDDEFVRYNVGGSKNNAYWVHRSNPEVVHCFVPDEPSFLFKEADPEMYAAHVAKYGLAYDIVKDTKAEVLRKVQRSMFIDQVSDMYVTMEYDIENDEVVEVNTRKNGQVAEEWMKHYGQLVPDPVPAKYVVSDPTRTEKLYSVGDKEYVNCFTPTVYMRDKNTYAFPDEATYGNAWLLHLKCPVISEIILNMLGDDLDCFEHFINWLAFILQRKDKTQTAWLLHGTEGTGKGLFFKRILQELFSDKYAVQNTLQGIADDQFNGWMEHLLVLMVDEFNMRGAQSLQKTASLLKTRITEPTMMVRNMQQGQRPATQRLNFIFATNDLDAMPVQDKRRYNIAPRQQRDLEARLPYIKTHRFETDELIAKELFEFATMLRSFKVSDHQAMTILENQARIDTQQAGMSASDKFFYSLAEGDFGAFIGILDKSTSNLEPRELMQLSAVKTFLTANLPHVNTGKACYLLPDDLRVLYSYLAGKDISENALTRMLATHDVSRKRKSKPVGVNRALPSRPRCIEVFWNYSDLKTLEEIREANRPYTGNVTSMDEQRQREQDELAMKEAQEYLNSTQK